MLTICHQNENELVSKNGREKGAGNYTTLESFRNNRKYWWLWLRGRKSRIFQFLHQSTSRERKLYSWQGDFSYSQNGNDYSLKECVEEFQLKEYEIATNIAYIHDS